MLAYVQRHCRWKIPLEFVPCFDNQSLLSVFIDSGPRIIASKIWSVRNFHADVFGFPYVLCLTRPTIWFMLDDAWLLESLNVFSDLGSHSASATDTGRYRGCQNPKIYMKSSSTVRFDQISHWSYCKIPTPRFIYVLEDFFNLTSPPSIVHPLNLGRSSLPPYLVIERKVLLLIKKKNTEARDYITI